MYCFKNAISLLLLNVHFKCLAVPSLSAQSVHLVAAIALSLMSDYGVFLHSFAVLHF
jgi:hypothetical protein